MNGYHVASAMGADGIEYHVQWEGKFDAIAVCPEHRDAQRICDALNAKPLVAAIVWAWVPVSERLPDDDLLVLVAMKSERLVLAVHLDGHWYQYGHHVGQRLAASHITHWVDPQMPDASAQLPNASAQPPKVG